MKFNASLDNIAKILTIITCGAFLIFVYSQIQNIIENKDYIMIPIILAITIIFVFVYLYSIKSYSVVDDQLVIQRVYKDLILSKKEIASIEKLENNFSRSLIRTFGNGGLFGYHGNYRSFQIGSFKFYGTQRKNFVLIKKINGQQIVVTPDQPNEFIDALK